jgi:molybdopterin-guanine dinucleotide biosynthesis protein A
MKPDPSITIVLLAGGRAARLPGKLSLPVGGEAMLVRVFRRLSRTGLPCVISVREPLPEAIAREMPVATIIDQYDDAGPLGGLASAAAHVSTPLLFAAAGDLPNIDAGAIAVLERALNDRAPAADRTIEAVVPRHSDGRLEPLAALYGTAALLRSAQRALESGHRRVSKALEGLRVLYYDIPAAHEHAYLNINTPADLAGIPVS